jgi:hypothetical protein
MVHTDASREAASVQKKRYIQRCKEQGKCIECGSDVWRANAARCRACQDTQNKWSKQRLADPQAKAANTERLRLWHLQTTYGLTPESYNALLESQDGHCAICDRTDGLHVDHDHVTSKVRGLLCGSHNRGLGIFNDSPEQLEAAAAYLRSSAHVDSR